MTFPHTELTSSEAAVLKALRRAPAWARDGAWGAAQARMFIRSMAQRPGHGVPERCLEMTADAYAVAMRGLASKGALTRVQRGQWMLTAQGTSEARADSPAETM